MQKYFFFTLLLIVLFFAALIYFMVTKKPTVPKTAQLEIGGQVFNVDIADTIMLRTRGLSGRTQLAGNEGMLFIFSKPGFYDFWMRGMLIPIDIIWIKDNKVVGFAENADPAGGAKNIYSAPGEADKVLEIDAGLVKTIGIEVGSEVVIK